MNESINRVTRMILKQPLYIDVKIGDTDDDTFGQYYINTYKLTRNMLHCISYMEYDILRGVEVVTKPLGVKLSMGGKLLKPEDERFFIKALSEISKEAQENIKSEKIRELSINELSTVIYKLKQLPVNANIKNWDDVVTFLSRLKILTLFEVTDLIAKHFFEVYKYEQEDNYYYKPIKSAVVISTMYSTGHISTLNIFKNETRSY
jgi:hypothetical protein